MCLTGKGACAKVIGIQMSTNYSANGGCYVISDCMCMCVYNDILVLQYCYNWNDA